VARGSADAMKVVQKPVDKLIPYINNSRTHSDEQVAQIAASIKEFGWTNPILVDGENGIIAGHGRLMAARKLGYTEVPTIELKDLTETQRKAYIIADNRLALNAGWDNEMLTIELNDLLADGFALEMLGFDAGIVEQLLMGETADLGLLPEEKLDNFLNGDTKILRLAYDEQEFSQITDALQQLQQKTGVDDFSTIILDLVLKSCRK
jgi:ParB-like chromosome segregation protein Spo0J